MRLESEFYMLETIHRTGSGAEYPSYEILCTDGPGDPRINYQDQRKNYTKVRLLKCTVAEVVRDSTQSN